MIHRKTNLFNASNTGKAWDVIAGHTIIAVLYAASRLLQLCCRNQPRILLDEPHKAQFQCFSWLLLIFRPSRNDLTGNGRGWSWARDDSQTLRYDLY